MTRAPIDRRSFLGLGGATFICTLAGQQVLTGGGKHVDVAELSREVDVPPNVAAANGDRPAPRPPRSPR